MWTEGRYRWSFIDMHLGWKNEEYLSKLEPEKMIKLIKESGAQTMLVKCRPWNGLAYFPTEYGEMHPTLKKKGIDYTGTMVKLCRENGIAVKAYFSQQFDNWAYDHHPGWRVVDQDGKNALAYSTPTTLFRKPRYATVCLNNPEYREYAVGAIKEIVSKYNFDSIFIDMPLYPEVCYCSHCRERYFKETGLEMPDYVNWDDPEFRNWQRLREEWMGEFCRMLTAAVKTANPSCTCEHNQGGFHYNWQAGCTELVNDASDYLGGDTYDSYFEESFSCKYFRNISNSLPFVFIGSRCDPNLSYHTTTKASEQLIRQSIISLIHNGAYSICDGLNPDGTLVERAYTGAIKECFAATKPYEKYVNGNYVKNASVWYADRSKYDREDNGKRVIEASNKPAKTNRFYNTKMAAGRILNMTGIPFDAISSKNIKELNDDLLIISGVANITDTEMADIEAYIRRGGNVYISEKPGHKRFLELLEAEYVGDTVHNQTYMVPTEAGKKYFTDFDEFSPVFTGKHSRLLFSGEYETVATLALPYTTPDANDFAAIHSNPPGIYTDEPCCVIKKIGEGSIFWVGSALEFENYYSAKLAVGRIFRSLCGQLKFESEKNVFVETMLWEKDGKDYAAAINLQDVIPAAHMYGTKIILPYEARSVKLVNSDEMLEVKIVNGKTEITFPVFTLFSIAEIEK